MTPRWNRLLHSPLDLAGPFTSTDANRAGINRSGLRLLVQDGLLQHPVRGVYDLADREDSLEWRVACLRLVVPDDAVVVDRTAAWLHGAPMALAPGDHLDTPRVAVFRPPGYRLRNDLAISGERSLRSDDVRQLGGLRVTTPLRTACDLGRLVHRDAALAAMDSLARTAEFDVEELLGEVERFKGFRGVRQLRALAPLVDAGAESFGESALRLRWHEAGHLPWPQTQIPVLCGAATYRIDLGIEERRWGAEYDGEAFHGIDRRAHDERRRARLRAAGWTILVFGRDDVFGRRQNAMERLRSTFTVTPAERFERLHKRRLGEMPL